MCIEGSRIWSVGLSQQCLWGRCISAHDECIQWMGSVQVIIDDEV